MYITNIFSTTKHIEDAEDAEECQLNPRLCNNFESDTFLILGSINIFSFSFRC